MDRWTDARRRLVGGVTCLMPPNRKQPLLCVFAGFYPASTSCSEIEGSDEVVEWRLVAVAVAACDQQGEKLEKIQKLFCKVSLVFGVLFLQVSV